MPTAVVEIVSGPEHARFADAVPTKHRGSLRAALITAIKNEYSNEEIRLYSYDGSRWTAFFKRPFWYIGPSSE